MSFDYRTPRRPKSPIQTDDQGFVRSSAWSVQMIRAGKWVVYGRRATWSEIVNLADGMAQAGNNFDAAGAAVERTIAYIVSPDGQPYRCIEMVRPAKDGR